LSFLFFFCNFLFSAKPIAYWIEKCHEEPNNLYFCDPRVRAQTDADNKAEAQNAAAIVAAKADEGALLTKLAEAQAARTSLDMEILAASQYGTKDEVQAIRKRVEEVQKFVGGINTLVKEAKKKVETLKRHGKRGGSKRGARPEHGKRGGSKRGARPEHGKRGGSKHNGKHGGAKKVSEHKRPSPEHKRAR
jgi:hypothetical protein